MLLLRIINIYIALPYIQWQKTLILQALGLSGRTIAVALRDRYLKIKEILRQIERYQASLNFQHSPLHPRTL